MSKKTYNDLLNHVFECPKGMAVGITGYPGAGKTTLANFIVEDLNNMGREAILINTDWFFKMTLKAVSALSAEEQKNFPPVLLANGADIIETIHKIRRHQSVKLEKKFNINSGNMDLNIDIKPHSQNPIIIVEGVGVMQSQVAAEIDVPVLIDESLETSAQRCLQRLIKTGAMPNADITLRRRRALMVSPFIDSFSSRPGIYILPAPSLLETFKYQSRL